ncbi:MAG: DUF3604 domain-containing protein [Spirochaetes bacterium]|nr:DUF3604 domain-containing protein [Spirochaetota bacterium]
MVEGKRTAFTHFGMMPAMVTSSLGSAEHERVWERGALRDLWRRLLAQTGFPAVAHAEPGEIASGERHTLRILIHMEAEIAVGGHLTVLLPQFWGGIAQERDNTTFFLRKSPQTYPGYISSQISATATGESRVEGTITCCGSVHTAIDLVILDRPLAPGGRVDLVIGDPIGLGALPIDFSGTYHFNVAIDQKGDGVYAPVLPHPKIVVTAGVARGYRVMAPGRSPEATKAPKAVLMDLVQNEVNEARPPTVEIQEKPGYRFAIARNAKNGLGGRSNPWVEGPWSGKNHVFFGEIHAHTELSDGIRTADEAYEFSRDSLGLDFAALSDHFEERLPSIVHPSTARWMMAMDAAERHQRPARFVTLLGYEWTGNPHINIYFRGSRGVCLPSDHDGCQTPRGLYDRLEKEGFPYLAIPHHPKFLSQADWEKAKGPAQRLVEIYSGWGSSETGNGGSVDIAWASGQKLGVIAGTDCHIGRPGQGNRTHEGGGLACVLSPALTREAIFDGLYARQCYGTTGARILLDFSVNGAPMGGECSPATPNELTMRAIGEAAIKEVEILFNGAPILKENPKNEYIEMKRSHAGRGYYGVRITQEDGHRAWSSPIWVGDGAPSF